MLIDVVVADESLTVPLGRWHDQHTRLGEPFDRHAEQLCQSTEVPVPVHPSTDLAAARRASSDRLRTSHPPIWSLTRPIACMKAYIVVGPTNDHPACLSCFESIVEVSVIAGTSTAGVSEKVACGQKNAAIEP